MDSRQPGERWTQAFLVRMADAVSKGTDDPVAIATITLASVVLQVGDDLCQAIRSAAEPATPAAEEGGTDA